MSRRVVGFGWVIVGLLGLPRASAAQSILSGLADLKLSRGPMVTIGVAFYF
jgi:hypothetical protein